MGRGGGHLNHFKLWRPQWYLWNNWS